MRALNFIDVCAGAGGLSQGFIDCGFEPLLLNEYTQYEGATRKNDDSLY